MGSLGTAARCRTGAETESLGTTACFKTGSGMQSVGIPASNDLPVPAHDVALVQLKLEGKTFLHIILSTTNCT